MPVLNKKKPTKETIPKMKSPTRITLTNQKSCTSTTASLRKAMFKPQQKDKDLQTKLRNKFASPTDRLLSPCSQKLNDHKSKFLLTKSNPMKLNFTPEDKNGSDSDSDIEY